MEDITKELNRVFGGIEEIEIEEKKESNFLKRIKNCGKMVIAKKCESCGVVYYHGVYCHHRLCCKCAEKRHRELYHRLKDYVKSWKWALHLVLTLKVNEDLSGSIDLIKKGFKKIRRKFKIKRYVYGVEIIKKEKGWYVHLHCLVNKKRLNHKALSKEWKKITGNSFIVWIEKVKNRERGVLEVLKYCLKGIGSLSEEDLEEVNQAIYRKRLIGVDRGFSYFSSLDNIEIIGPKFYSKCFICDGDLRFLGVYSREEIEKYGVYALFGVYRGYDLDDFPDFFP